MAMDPFTRRLVEEAERIDDIARDRSDRFERKWAEREACLAAIEEWPQPQREVVLRKTYEPVPQRQSVMDAATEAHWNAWFAASFNNAVDRLIVPSVGDALGEIREELRKEFEKELGQLRSEMNVLNAIVRGEVKELKGRDAA